MLLKLVPTLSILFLVLLLGACTPCTPGTNVPEEDTVEEEIVSITYESCRLPNSTTHFKDAIVEYHPEFIRIFYTINENEYVRDYPKSTTGPHCINPK